MDSLEEKNRVSLADAATETNDQRILGLLKEVEELKASRDKLSRPVGTFSVGHFDDTTRLLKCVWYRCGHLNCEPGLSSLSRYRES